MPLHELYRPQPAAEGQDSALVDIIAVHGLNPKQKPVKDHAWDTWRKPDGSEGNLWLKDDLPQITPNARIFLYEYDSKVFTQDRAHFVDKVNLFLEHVRIKRNKTRLRPLLLLGHSLGGLFIKQALVHAFNNKKYEDILRSTQGLVFFATPHNGAKDSPVNIAKSAASIAINLGISKGDNIIETLKTGNMFSDLMSELYRQRLLDYQIVSFWGTRDDIVTRESASFGLPGDRENIVPLAANHRGVCKFGDDDEDQDNLILVLGNIEDLYEQAIKLVQQQLETPKQVLDLLRDLYQASYRDAKDVNPRRVKGTCEWFTNHPLFHQWRGSSSALLWVSADPGCGKSVLARYLADEVLPPTPSTVSCYFFFKDGLHQQMTSANALCCILRQIFEQRPTLASTTVLKQFREKGKGLMSSFRELWEILVSVAGDIGRSRILCILDALDECQDADRRLLLETIQDYYLRAGDRPNLSFLLTSRPYESIRVDLHDLVAKLPTIHLRGEDEYETDKIAREIDIVIGVRVTDISSKKGLTGHETEVLRSSMAKNLNRTYLWVYLIFEAMKDWLDWTKGRIKEQIQALPSGIEEVYEKSLSRSKDPEQTRKLLHLVLAATRPLSLAEMAVAMAAGDHRISNGELEIEPPERFSRKVRELCGLLLTIIDGKIHFLHQTVVEFLVQDVVTETGNSISLAETNLDSQWQRSLSLVTSNLTLGLACARYVISDHVEDHFKNLLPLKPIMSVSSFCGPSVKKAANYFETDLPFIAYAWENWAAHLRIANDESVLGDMLKLCRGDRASTLLWFREFWQTRDFGLQPDGLSPLVIASVLGLSPVTRWLLESSTTDANTRYGYEPQATSLCWAAYFGHESVVKSFIDAAHQRRVAGEHVDFNADLILLDEEPPSGWQAWRGPFSPLGFAVMSRHDRVAEMLLATGSVAFREDSLLEAAKTDQVELLATALLSSARVSEPRFYAQLHDSSDGDVVKAASVLLEKHFNSETLSRALIWAAAGGAERCTGMLLSVSSVDVNAQEDGYTSLLYAASYGHLGIVRKLLVTEKVDVNARGPGRRTPLAHAVSEGYDAIIRCLLAVPGIDVNSKDEDSMTPLVRTITDEFLSNESKIDIMSQLLENPSLDTGQKDSDGRTALSWVAQLGTVEMVKLVLQKSPSLVDVADKTGRTPLSLCANRDWSMFDDEDEGEETILRLLLETDCVNVNSRDHDGCEPIMHAYRNRRRTMIRVLKEHPDIDSDYDWM